MLFHGPELALHWKKLISVVLLSCISAHGSTQEHRHAPGEKLGEVHFSTTCNELAQSGFDRAVALLHSFQFSRAIEEFDAALRDDPTCAIAYWGIALSDWSNPFAPGQKSKSQLQLGQLAVGKDAEASRQMEMAANMEDGTEKSVVTPGPLFPARELLGDMFLKTHQPAKALVQFEATLEKEPRRFRSTYGAAHAAQLVGRRATSQHYFKELLRICAKADKPGRSEIEEARQASNETAR